MTRTILAIATSLIASATLFASGAQACISCEYTPEVVRPHLTNQAKRPQKRRVYVAETQQKRLPAPQKTRVAKADPAPAAKTAPTKVATAEAPAEEAQPQREPPVSTAMLLETGRQTTNATPEPAAEVGCKKFFPAVGKTMTVPCE